MTQIDVSPGQKVRRYDEDDYFEEGVITISNYLYVEVDFDNSIVRFSPADFGMICEFFEDIIATTKRGILIEDFMQSQLP